MDGVDMIELFEIIEQKISCASLVSKPFSFFEINELIPSGLYEELISNLPDIGSYKPLSHRETLLNGVPTRFEMPLSFEDLHREVTQAFCNCPLAGDLLEVFCSDAFVEVLLKKFGLSADLIPYPHLYRDQAGFKLPPHTDIEEKAITFGWYLPTDTSHVESGLKLYERVSEEVVSFKRIDYVPNKAFAFMRSENSWHGAEHAPKSQYDRNSLFVTCYNKKFYSDGHLSVRDPNVDRSEINILGSFSK